MKVIFQQVDLDTCLTALLLGVTKDDELCCRRGEAIPEELADSGVLCIEAGGSGQVERNNFDHHDTADALPSACVQAYESVGRPRHLPETGKLKPLVEYVACIDQAANSLSPIQGHTLSGVFSGMRLAVRDPARQMRAGLGLLRTVLTEGIDPYGAMPARPEWRDYIAAKEADQRGLAEIERKATFHQSRQGRRVGYVETAFVGALGALYQQGCAIAVAYNRGFGDPPIKKYTIGGNDVRVASLLPFLTQQEAGWGGPAHGTILGSPRTGSALRPEQVVALVLEHL